MLEHLEKIYLLPLNKNFMLKFYQYLRARNNDIYGDNQQETKAILKKVYVSRIQHTPNIWDYYYQTHMEAIWCNMIDILV